jgi:hypothetical protein
MAKDIKQHHSQFEDVEKIASCVFDESNDFITNLDFTDVVFEQSTEPKEKLKKKTSLKCKSKTLSLLKKQSNKRPLNKNLIQCYIKEKTGVSYEVAKEMFESLLQLLKYELTPDGNGKIILPGVLTMQVHARNVAAIDDKEKSPSIRVIVDKELKSEVSKNKITAYKHIKR